MSDANKDNSEEPKHPLPDLPGISLRQLFLFREIMQAGSQAEIAERYLDLSRSNLSKEIGQLRQQLNLSYLSDKEFWESAEAATLKGAFDKLMDVVDKLGKSAHQKIISIGAGGSLLAWKIGKHCAEIRDACSHTVESGMNFSDVRLSCRPMTNRDILSYVHEGMLDFGLVRQSLLTHARAANAKNASVASKPLGQVTYGIAIPKLLKQSWLENGTDFSTDPGGYLIHESSILDCGYFASVGPEGEFKEQLSRALLDAGIDLKIEFNYRSFPQIIPHLIAGTHFGLCPIFDKDEPQLPGGTEIYPLKLMSHYKREIVLIWNQKLKRSWVNIERIADILKWESSKSNCC